MLISCVVLEKVLPERNIRLALHMPPKKLKQFTGREIHCDVDPLNAASGANVLPHCGRVKVPSDR